MAAQTLEQVLASLNGVYQPQLDAVATQQAQLPQQFQAQEAGLNATKDQAFGSILNGARSRGTGVAFGGIPAGEQAQYLASSYLPSLAGLKTSQNNQSASLIDAINKINQDKFNTGNSIFQFGVQQDLAERQFEEQKAEAARQAAASARAAAGSFSPTYGGAAASGGGAAAGKPGATPEYIGNNDLRGHYNYLATKQGNQDAVVALKYVGNDGKFNLNPYVTNPAVLQALARIGATNVWKASNSSPARPAATSVSGLNLGGSTAGLGRLGF